MDESEAWYRGDVVNCIRRGKGTYNYPFGGQKLFTYNGNWKQGVKHEKGNFKINGHSTYSGEMKDGEMTGKGSKKWDDGRTYDGEWLNGEMHGKGYWVNTKTNEVYDGFFADNRRNGMGSLQRGLESYKGEFLNHKFHGKGLYLYSNKFILDGEFQENILQGSFSVDWLRLAFSNAEWTDGLLCGDGFFSVRDGSFDFQGRWTEGLPELTQSAGSLWLAVDRTQVDIENARAKEAKGLGGGKDKKKVPPPKKGKNDAATIEPTLTALHGENLGLVDIRCVLAKDGTEVVPDVIAVDPKKAPAKGAPVAVTAPAPPIFAVPNERTRRVTIRLRPIIEEIPDPAAPPLSKAAAAALLEEPTPPLQFGPPVSFWLKHQSQEQAGCRRSRFSPRSIVLMCDAVTSEQSWPRAYSLLSGAPSPALVFRRLTSDDDISLVSGAEAAVEGRVSSSNVSSKPVYNASELSSVAAHALTRYLTASVRLDSSRLERSEEQISFVIDFSIDAATCIQQHIDRYQPDGYYRENKRSLSRSAATGSKSGNTLLQTVGSRSGASQMVSTPPSASPQRRVGKTFKSRDMELLVCSFSKLSPERPETDFKRLDLVLVVALRNTDEVYVQKRDAAAAAEEAANIAAEKSRRASFMGSVESLLASVAEAPPAPPVVWIDCYWELRSTVTITTITTVMVSDSSSASDVKNRASSLSVAGEASLGGGDEAEAATSLVGDIDLDSLGLADAPPVTTISSMETITSVCGQWLCGDFCPDQWHSVAITLRGGASDGDSPRVGFRNQVDDESSEERPRSSSARREDVSGVVSAELVFDGQGRMRMAPGALKRASSPTAASYEASLQQGANASKQTQVAVSDWMCDYPQYVDPSALTASSSTASITKQQTARKASVTKATLPEVLLPVDVNNQLVVTLGSDTFNGLVKGVAACTASDRCDLLQATNCYEGWRATQEARRSAHETEITASSSVPFNDNGNDASVLSMIPENYSLVTEFCEDLFCGSAEIPFDRIRIPTASQAEGAASLVPEGLYVLEVSEGVNEECLLPVQTEGEQPSPRERRKEPPHPRDVLDMARVVRRVPPNVDVVVKIEPAEV